MIVLINGFLYFIAVLFEGFRPLTGIVDTVVFPIGVILRANRAFEFLCFIYICVIAIFHVVLILCGQVA